MRGGRITLLVLVAAATVAPAAAGGASVRGASQIEPVRVGNPPVAAAQGRAFTARVRVLNRSLRTSKSASVTFRLAPPAGKHLLLPGKVRIGLLGRRRSKAARLRVTVPADARTGGTYRLIACVKQSRVKARCRSSARLLRVPAPPASSNSPLTPAPTAATPSAEPSRKAPPSVAIGAPAEGDENPGRRPAFAGSASPDHPRTVTLDVHPGYGTATAPVQTLTAPVSDTGDWSATPSSDLPPGPYTAVARQADDAGDPGRSTERRFHVAAVMVTAGDIASCSSSATGDDATAALLDADRGDVVAVLGDLVYPSSAYPDASLPNFNACYGPNWGRHKDVSRPVVGNHEYDGQLNAEGYFAYFENRAGPAPQGWYSYDLGGWHVIALNSNCGAANPKVSCTTTSEQAAWLRADLADHPARCTVAYWHHPRFSSWSETAPRPEVAPLWQILDEAGADLILTGHAHAYERFAPQTHDGFADPAGIRQFIVGTGGINKHQFNMESRNSEKADNSTFGVLDLTLRATGYDWRFRPVAGGSFTDAGSASCG